MEHSDFYNFATHFWWLIFPLVWGCAAFLRIWTRHNESQRILDMVKTYADQGKEPPAALTEMFRAPRDGRRGCGDRYVEPYYTHRLWRRAFLFGFLCIAFIVMAIQRGSWDGDWHGHHGDSGLVIAAVVMGAICVSCIAALLTRPRLPPDQK
jgi:hypothetical protein